METYKLESHCVGTITRNNEVIARYTDNIDVTVEAISDIVEAVKVAASVIALKIVEDEAK